MVIACLWKHGTFQLICYIWWGRGGEVRIGDNVNAEHLPKNINFYCFYKPKTNSHKTMLRQRVHNTFKITQEAAINLHKCSPRKHFCGFPPAYPTLPPYPYSILLSCFICMTGCSSPWLLGHSYNHPPIPPLIHTFSTNNVNICNITLSHTHTHTPTQNGWGCGYFSM